MQNYREVGGLYEGRVANWLSAHGYQILERNFRCRLGEIDLIAQKEGMVVFVEVKYRSGSACGAPEEAVDYRKQVRISNAASYYLYKHFYPQETSCRFDVAAVSRDGIRLIENAFFYCGNFMT
ncbi:MAG: YraN family protein [Lachnospiraceae bacterium]|nr:YraN family protein [Lachnospiraceae bacterium]